MWSCWRRAVTRSRRRRCIRAEGGTDGRNIGGPGIRRSRRCPNSWLQFISGNTQARNEPAAADGDAIPEGSRNTELTRVAGQMRRAGLSEADMLAALRGVNKARCRPPLDDGEVAQIARNVAQYPAGAEPRDEGQKVAQALLDAEFAGGQWLRYEADGHFWSWTGTHWAVIPDKILQQKILKIVNGEVLVDEVGEDAGQRGLRALADHASARRRPAAFCLGAAERRQRSPIASCGFTTTEPSKRGRTIPPPACGTS